MFIQQQHGTAEYNGADLTAEAICEAMERHAQQMQYEETLAEDLSDIISGEELRKRFNENYGKINASFVEGWGIERGSRCVIVGNPKVGKSVFATQFALSVANGAEFMGRSTKQAKVLYVYPEGSVAQQDDRTKEITETHGLASLDNYYFWSTIGKKITIQRIVQVAKCLNFDIVVLDSYYRLFDGDEKENKDTKELIQSFDLFKENNITLVYIAHTNKYANAGDTRITDAISGSGVLGRDWDTAIRLSTHGVDEDYVNIEVYSRARKGDRIATTTARKPTLEELDEHKYGFFFTPEAHKVLATAKSESARREKQYKQDEQLFSQRRTTGEAPATQNEADDYSRVIVKLIALNPKISKSQLEDTLCREYKIIRAKARAETQRHELEIYRKRRDGNNIYCELTPKGLEILREINGAGQEGEDLPPPAPAQKEEME